MARAPRLLPPWSWSLALAALCAAALARADEPSTNTSKEVELEVRLAEGEPVSGRVRFRKDKLEVKGSRTKRYRYGEVASLGVVPPPSRDELVANYQRRAERLGADDALGWVRLARWARDRELADLARAAFEKVIAAQADHEEARRGLGQVRDEDGRDVDGDGWVNAMAVFDRKRAALPADAAARVEGLVELAREARRADQDLLAFDYLREALLLDNYHEQALGLIRRDLDRYRQQTELWLPVRERWRASEDETRHHQKKSFALFALDLIKVDEKGRHHRGNGRKLEDHFAYGAPFFAVADGTVVEVRDGFPDNPIGRIDGRYEKHNGLAIQHGNGEYSWYVHAKNGTLTVKLGDRVRRGQKLGEIGNSGGSAIPHLHFTLVAYRGISVPWACDDYTLIAPDGTSIPVERAWPREGWTIQADQPEVPPPAAEPAADGPQGGEQGAPRGDDAAGGAAGGGASGGGASGDTAGQE